MSRQTFTGKIQWIVVDDGDVPTTCTRGQEYIRVTRSPRAVVTTHNHTVGDNLHRGLALARAPFILVIEDDDYYSPAYISTYLSWLQNAMLVGEAGAKYYRLDTRTYQHFSEGAFREHAALARTGFRAGLIPFVEKCCQGNSEVDMRIWQNYHGSPVYLQAPSVSGLHVSIKGGPGRLGHTHRRHLQDRDPNCLKLLEWTCGDWDAVNQYQQLCTHDSLTVYTGQTRNRHGNPYSRLKPPVSRPEEVDFVCFTTLPNYAPSGWKSRQAHLDIINRDPEREDIQSRYWKILPHRWFPAAEWTLWVDASMHLQVNPRHVLSHARSRWGEFDMAVVRHPYQSDTDMWNVGKECDWIAKERHAPRELVGVQKADYASQGWSKLRAYQCCLILRRNTEKVAKFGEIWWDHLLQYQHRRDQPSFAVAAHLSGIDVKEFSHKEAKKKFTRWVGHTADRTRY